jgi:hypothetical protein
MEKTSVCASRHGPFLVSREVAVQRRHLLEAAALADQSFGAARCAGQDRGMHPALVGGQRERGPQAQPRIISENAPQGWSRLAGVSQLRKLLPSNSRIHPACFYPGVGTLLAVRHRRPGEP